MLEGALAWLLASASIGVAVGSFLRWSDRPLRDDDDFTAFPKSHREALGSQADAFLVSHAGEGVGQTIEQAQSHRLGGYQSSDPQIYGNP